MVLIYETYHLSFICSSDDSTIDMQEVQIVVVVDDVVAAADAA
jgi:hypothetical protein